MRLFLLILFSALLGVNAAGQNASPPHPPDIGISEWGRSVYFSHSSRLARRNSSSITADDVATSNRRERRRQDARDETSGTISPPVAPDPFSIGPKELRGGLYGFLYKVRVENKGAKKIKTIAWEYVFLDPLDRSVISRHQFLSKVKISPGKKKKVSALTIRQPMQVGRAEAANLPPVEQVVIKRVEYADGSVWERQ